MTMEYKPPRALGWVGGKSFYGTHKTGRWIAGLLPPPEATYTYLEVYAGMLGILLQRRPAKREIVSDLDGDLINWWTVVRDQPEELAELLEWTPSWSSDLFAEACHNLDFPEPVRRAYYFTLACHWVRGGMIERVRGRSRQASDDDGMRRRIKGIGEPEPARGYDGLIKRTKHPDGGDETGSKQSSRFIDPGISRYSVSPNEVWCNRDSRHRPGRPVRLSYDELGPPRYEQILSLARRIRRLQLEVRSAEWMTEYYGVNPNLTIYLDPPYPSAEKSNLYSFPIPVVEDWIPRLLAVKSYVAISGYGSEWSVLEDHGWHRYEHLTHMSAGAQGNMARPERVEVLWTNYDAERFQQCQTSLF